MDQVKPGDVLVADMTDPNWEPVMKRASAIVTNRGGRTCHAAIIARELGIPAIVGCGDATETLKNYSGILEEGRADLVALYFLMDPNRITSYNVCYTKLLRMAFGWMPITLLMMNSTRARPTPAFGNWANSKASSGLPTFIMTLTGTSYNFV